MLKEAVKLTGQGGFKKSCKIAKNPLIVWIFSLCYLVLPMTSYAVTLSPSSVNLLVESAIAQNSKTYRVKLGDTLSGIGVKFGLTMAQLLTYNPALKANPDLLRIGQTINLTNIQASSTTPPKVAKRPRQSPFGVNLPRERRTGNRVMATTRGLASCLKNPDQRLKILLPNTNFGYTLQDYPTFFWYVPPLIESTTTEFRLLTVNKESKEAETEIYQGVIKPNANTIASFALPTDAPALKEGEEYQWEITIKCNKVTAATLKGRIQRLTTDNPVLGQKLEQAAIEDYPAILAEAGVWYDALATLAALRREKPTDQVLSQDWATILKMIGYQDLGNIPEEKVTVSR